MNDDIDEMMVVWVPVGTLAGIENSATHNTSANDWQMLCIFTLTRAGGFTCVFFSLFFNIVGPFCLGMSVIHCTCLLKSKNVLCDVLYQCRLIYCWGDSFQPNCTADNNSPLYFGSSRPIDFTFFCVSCPFVGLWLHFSSHRMSAGFLFAPLLFHRTMCVYPRVYANEWSQI